MGIRWRPFLNQQVLVELGASGFDPGRGFKDIYSSNCAGQNCGAKPKQLYQVFGSVVLAY